MAKFKVQRLKDGRKHVIQTDSAADYLRCLIDEMASDFNVLCHVSVSESPATAGAVAPGSTAAMHVQVESAGEAALLDRSSEFRFGEFADELHDIFSKFYDCDAAGVAGVSRAWTVRHRRGCPWI